MTTQKLTVTVDARLIHQLDRWVRQGRYPNRSQATQAALRLLERRNALPTLEETLLAGRRRRSAEEQAAWQGELADIDRALDALEPPVNDD
jgi:Arc/MetJ-type ribon-helix-helix transcriptional regulator